MQDPDREKLKGMIEDAPLNLLCYTCKSALPKYTCPRCRRRTCSLPCCQQHKKWDQCNGKRDQAAYVKASHLYTPAGVDHDYNFITSIERGFDKADRELEECGIDAEDDDRRTRGKAFHEALAKTNVFVQNAPKGLSRQKHNTTFWSKRQRGIIWTVEFVHPDGSKQLAMLPQNQPIDKKYEAICKQRNGTHSNKPQHEPKAAITESDKNDNPPSKKRKVDTHISIAHAQPTPNDSVPTEDAQTSSSMSPTKPDTTQPTPRSSDAALITPSATHSQTNLHFYLHKPLTIGPGPVLIPLDPNITLLRALNSRVVLEFPTIHVMHHPPDQLPDGFMVESAYLDKRNALIKEVDEELGSVGVGVGKATVDDGVDDVRDNVVKGQEEADVTDSKVMASLRKDLEGASCFAENAS